MSTIFIAHRGESLDAPENTLASVRLAWARNADAVEIDIHMTADRKIAVIHDSNTRRTSGKYLKVKEQTLTELKKLNVGKYNGRTWPEEKIPSLEEVLDTVPAGRMLFIEIKSGPEIIDELYSAVNRSRLSPGQVKIIGFNLKTISSAKNIFTGCEVFWLKNIDKNYFQFWKPGIDEIISTSIKNKLNGLDVKYSKSVDERFVGFVRKAGLKLYVWTVNDPQVAGELIKLNVDGITSDNQLLLKEKLGII